MKATADHLGETVEAALPLLRRLTREEVVADPYPPTWSKIEILGHLIDSAGNNQQKFVRTRAQPTLTFPRYAQNQWTDAQHYLAADWMLLVELFGLYSIHLAHVIEHADPATLGHTIVIEGAPHDPPAGPFTLRFIMTGYVEHMRHHLRQILPGGPFDHAFKNVHGAERSPIHGGHFKSSLRLVPRAVSAVLTNVSLSRITACAGRLGERVVTPGIFFTAVPMARNSMMPPPSW